MATEVVSEVVGKRSNLVVYTVVVAKELITGTDIGFHNLFSIFVTASHDVNKREKGRITATDVLYVSIREEQLVAYLVGETAVQVGRYGLYIIFL